VNTDDVLSAAIRDKQCLTGLYDSAVRHFAPHALGATGGAESAVFVFQYAGETTTGLPVGGEWRCFLLDRLSLKRQTCLATVRVGLPISS